MDASDGNFAYYLCGIMNVLSENGSPCPDPDAEALSYLETLYPEVLAKEDADANNETPNHLLS